MFWSASRGEKNRTYSSLVFSRVPLGTVECVWVGGGWGEESGEGGGDFCKLFSGNMVK